MNAIFCAAKDQQVRLDETHEFEVKIQFDFANDIKDVPFEKTKFSAFYHHCGDVSNIPTTAFNRVINCSARWNGCWEFPILYNHRIKKTTEHHVNKKRFHYPLGTNYDSIT